MALVLGVMASSTDSTLIVNKFGHTSTRTGVKPKSAITSTVEAKVKSVVMTSSPGLSPKPIIAI